MRYRRARDMLDISVGPALMCTNTEFRLFAAYRQRIYPSNPVGKTTNRIKEGAPEGHITADWIAYRLHLLRKSRVRTSNDPVKLGWKPARSAPFPR